MYRNFKYIFIILFLLLVSCRADNIKSTHSTSSLNVVKAQPVFYDASSAEIDGGIYFIHNNMIHFYDYVNHKEGIVCNKVNCSHEHGLKGADKCNADIDVLTVSVFEHANELYTLSYCGGEDSKIYIKIAKTKLDRSPIDEALLGVDYIQSYVIDGNSLYLATNDLALVGDGDFNPSGVLTSKLIEVKLDTLDIIEHYVFPGNYLATFNLLAVVDEQILYTYTYFEENYYINGAVHFDDKAASTYKTEYGYFSLSDLSDVFQNMECGSSLARSYLQLKYYNNCIYFIKEGFIDADDYMDSSKEFFKFSLNALNLEKQDIETVYSSTSKSDKFFFINEYFLFQNQDNSYTSVNLNTGEEILFDLPEDIKLIDFKYEVESDYVYGVCEYRSDSSSHSCFISAKELCNGNIKHLRIIN